MYVMAHLMEPEVSVGAATEWTPLQCSWRRTSSASGSILGWRRRRRCWVLQRRRNSVSQRPCPGSSVMSTQMDCKVRALTWCRVLRQVCHSVGVAGKFSSWQQPHSLLPHMHWLTSFLRFRVPLLIQHALSTAECFFIDNSCLKGKVVRVHAMKADGSRGIAPLILNLDTGWRWVVNITTHPLHPHESIPLSTE